MKSLRKIGSIQLGLLSALIAVGLLSATTSFAADAHSTTMFVGVKANTGKAMHTREGGKDVLAVSDDFKIPETPAPHWQVVDSKGNVYLLNQLRIKDGKFNRKITLPSYIQDVARVQIWCSFVEALLGAASFQAPIKTVAAEGPGMMQTSAMGR